MSSRRAIAAALLLLAAAGVAAADPDALDALGPHPDARWWLSATLDATLAAQPGFHSPYAGADSFAADDHVALTVVPALHGGYALTRTTAVIVSGASAIGDGLGAGQGLGGYIDMDERSGPQRGATPFLGDAYVEQLIPLARATTPHARDATHLLALPERRLAIRAGQLAATDSFDRATLPAQNEAVAHDAAYDHAENAHGYTVGAVIEYAGPLVAVRVGELVMPKLPRGEALEYDLTRSRSETIELELHDCIAGRPGSIRARAYENHTVSGNYAEALAEYRVDITDTPDVTLTRATGRTKAGYAADWTQVVTGPLRAFARVGESDGATESFAFAEVDNTVAGGATVRGAWWQRPDDQLMLAVASNGLSSDHRDYLEAGGLGTWLGDGTLRYAREDIVEASYSLRVMRGLSIAADLQGIDHPGFNRQRGPVGVGLLHVRVAL